MPRSLRVTAGHAAAYAAKAESATAPLKNEPAVGLRFLPVYHAQGKTLAARVADACARYTEATGAEPTCIRVPPGTGNPPEGCGLRWEERRGIDPGWLWPGGPVADAP